MKKLNYIILLLLSFAVYFISRILLDMTEISLWNQGYFCGVITATLNIIFAYALTPKTNTDE